MIFPLLSPITRIYLIRHARTAQNAKGLVSGDTDNDLDIRGVTQAKALRDRLLQDFPVHVIYSSPKKRSVQTAEIVAKGFDLPINIDQDLVEFGYGVLENKSIDDMKNENPILYKEMIAWTEASPDEKIVRPDFPGWESFESIKTRINDFTKKILLDYSGKNIAIITHGGYIRCSLMNYIGGDFSRKFPFVVNNASITIVDFYKGNATVCLFNENCHTEEDTRRGEPFPL